MYNSGDITQTMLNFLIIQIFTKQITNEKKSVLMCYQTHHLPYDCFDGNCKNNE